jgi:hypothetical protein
MAFCHKNQYFFITHFNLTVGVLYPWLASSLVSLTQLIWLFFSSAESSVSSIRQVGIHTGLAGQ